MTPEMPSEPHSPAKSMPEATVPGSLAPGAGLEQAPAPDSAVDSAAAAPAPESAFQRALPGMKKAARVAEPLSVAGVFIFLLAKSWMRWPDPLIDFPRDLYIAWRVSAGDMLYEKVGNAPEVASWYGPLAHLAEGAGFRIFGVGMDTIVWMNVFLTVGILLLLRGIFGVMGNRFSVWLCSMTFLLVFFVCHLVDLGNYNFITPYVAQTTYGLAGLLLMLWALLWHLRSDWGWWLWLAGVGVGVTYLDKPEPLLAAAGALGVYGAAQLVQRFRQKTPGGGWRGAWVLGWTSAVWLGVGFGVTWAPVFIYFLARGGVAYALKATDWVPYTMMADSFRKTVANSAIFSSFFGFDHPLQNFLSHLQAGALLLLVGSLLVAGSRAWAGADKFSFWWWVGPVVVVAAGGLGAWLGEEANYWTEIGKAFNFSTIILTAVAVVWAGWAAWLGRVDFERALGLAVVGTAAVLMLARMILFGRVYHYGFFMAPLAVLFVVHLVVGEGARAGEGQRRCNWLLPVVFAAVVLYGGLSLTQLSLRRYSLKTFEVGSGRDRFYTFQPKPEPGVAVKLGDVYAPSGLYLKLMLAEARQALPKARTLIAFPETAAINYHLRVPCPVAEVEFHPTGLGFVGPDHVVEELKANPPDGVFFYMRLMLEYGVPYFGATEASGQAILQWVEGNYVEVWNAGAHTQYLRNLYPNTPPEKNFPLTPTGDAIDLLVPGQHPAPSSFPSPDQLMNSIRPQ
jgi:hypothetical protein